jgi:hypothetical protein
VLFSACGRRPETRRSQTCLRLFSSRRAVSFGLPSSTGNDTWGQSNVGNPRRAFFLFVTARLPSVRPWNAPSNEMMKPPFGSPVVFTRLRRTDLIAFSTASAPVLTTKWRGVPAGAMLFSSAFSCSDTAVWYSECA